MERRAAHSAWPKALSPPIHLEDASTPQEVPHLDSPMAYQVAAAHQRLNTSGCALKEAGADGPDATLGLLAILAGTAPSLGSCKTVLVRTPPSSSSLCFK